MASNAYHPAATNTLGTDLSVEEGIDHNASQCFIAPITSTDAKIEKLEEKILELEGKIKNLTGDTADTNLNAAGLALKFVHIDKCS